MADTDRDMSLAQRQSGLLGRAMIRTFMRQAKVVRAEPLAPGFRLIEFSGPQLRGAVWSPGDKVQIAIGSAFVTRTYTPIAWDVENGGTRILAYTHGAGPGSDWIGAVAPSETCDLFGPRRSLDVSGIGSRVVLLGDETSLGLFAAMSDANYACDVTCLLEVGSADAARDVIAALQLSPADLFVRTDGDRHLAQVESRLADLAVSGAAFVLTGKASSIQRLHQALKRLEVGSSRITTKAYWAPGKAGLD